jgi:hypothetical protein
MEKSAGKIAPERYIIKVTLKDYSSQTIEK